MSDGKTLPGGPTPDEPTQPLTGAEASGSFGPYRLLQLIGEGGMGEVYMAEQVYPLRRQVALKVIKKGMDTKEVIARFQAERQALALMNHRCIAKVFDAGEAPNGRPFIAMEYVKGVPITEYCNRHQLDLHQRLELFILVCEGVQHAHQKAVIHRDLKPSNVLVTEEDSQPIPKIIDFGVAKATSRRLTDMTMFTQVGQMIGTLEYMSPEQAELTGEDVDTRTDVYSLGAILYELLVGVLPFDSQVLRQAGYEEMRRIIRDQTPLAPSTRLTVPDQSTQSTLKTRGTDHARWVRSLTGDMDWIVLKALEKERSRRFASPGDLADDIRRFMNNEPIVARPPSTAYRVRKFVQRHRLPVVLAACVAVALLGGIVATSWGLWRATRAETLARQEAERANFEANSAREVTDFMLSMFEQANPHQARGQAVTVRQMLDLGAARIESELADDPVLQVRLMTTMGSCYRDLGEFAPALELLQGAVSRVQAQGQGETAEAARLYGGLAYLQTFMGQYAQAERNYAQAVQVARRLPEPAPQELAGDLQGYAFVFLRARRDYDKAQQAVQEALAIYDKEGVGDDWGRASALMHLGWVLVLQGDDAAAEQPHRQALAMRRRLAAGEDHPAIGWSLTHLSNLLSRQGEFQEALAMVREAYEMNLRLFGPLHPEIGYNFNSLGNINAAMGDLPQAEANLTRAVEVTSEMAGPDHPELIQMLNRLAMVQARRGKFAEAEANLARSRRLVQSGDPGASPFAASLQKAEDEVRDLKAQEGGGK